MIVAIVVLGLILVAATILQIHLSKNIERRSGIVIPILSFLCSLGMTYIVFNVVTVTVRLKLAKINAGEMTLKDAGYVTAASATRSVLIGVIVTFLITNIPTVVFYVIYRYHIRLYKKNLESKQETEQGIQIN